MVMEAGYCTMQVKMIELATIEKMNIGENEL